MTKGTIGSTPRKRTVVLSRGNTDSGLGQHIWLQSPYRLLYDHDSSFWSSILYPILGYFRIRDGLISITSHRQSALGFRRGGLNRLSSVLIYLRKNGRRHNSSFILRAFDQNSANKLECRVHIRNQDPAGILIKKTTLFPS